MSFDIMVYDYEVAFIQWALPDSQKSDQIYWILNSWSFTCKILRAIVFLLKKCLVKYINKNVMISMLLLALNNLSSSHWAFGTSWIQMGHWDSTFFLISTINLHYLLLKVKGKKTMCQNPKIHSSNSLKTIT